MPDGWVSSQNSGGYLVRTQSRVVRTERPYIASGYRSSLTPKEKLARQMTKSASGFGGGSGNTMMSGTDNFFSPQLSTDFLELPQSLREKREIYRHFYNTDELVGQAIDLHTELPLSKVRLASPNPRTYPKGFKDSHDYGKYILSRFERMCKSIKLFQRMITMVHHYWLDGTCLPADEWVTVGAGVTKAEDVSVGDLVLTHEGRWRPVTAKLELGPQPLVKLGIARLPGFLRVTPEHPIEALKNGSPDFVAAGTLTEGDYVRVTWPTEEVDVESVILSDGRSLPIGDDLLYALGYWLGDGIGPEGSWSVRGYKPYVQRVEASLVKLLGPSAVARSFKEGDLQDLNVHEDSVFVRWWFEEFGDVTQKRIPCWVLTLPESKQLALLAGLIDSNSCTMGTDLGGIRLELTSLNLISSVRDIFLRTGAIPSLYSYGATYLLVTYVDSDDRKLTSKACKRDRLDSCVRTEDGNLYFKIRSVSADSPEKVYNIQVAEDSTFRARFVSTHNCAIFAEDSSVETPMDVGYARNVQAVAELTEGGDVVEYEKEVWTPKENVEDAELEYYRKNYKGWNRLIILPIDKVKITTFGFTDHVKIELIPSDRDRALLDQANQGDPEAQAVVEKIPEEVREYMSSGRLIPMGTDPDEGSFVYLLSGRKHADSEVGQSILDRLLRTLYYREKLRQAQTSIASRAMTPKRLIWAENLSNVDVEALRAEVDLALVDPDYSIVTNYEVRWEEMGARDRLLDLSSEYEQTERRMLIGLGVTEGLMSGETLYSGDRLKLESLNTRYLHLREILQEYVHEYLFEPVARRMGFVEQDEWGQEVVLYPRLSFTRLPLRDSQDTFDALFNLYQKGSVSIDVILEILNIDPADTKTKLEEDLFTVNDSTFNEVIRSAASEVGRNLVEKYNVTEQVAKYLKFDKSSDKDASGGEGRF